MMDPRASEFDNGLRVLARMIARVYLKDLAAGRIGRKGEHCADKRSSRGNKTSLAGKDKAGDKEGKP